MKKGMALLLIAAMLTIAGLAAAEGIDGSKYTAVQIRAEIEENEVQEVVKSGDHGEYGAGTVLFADTLNEALMTLKSGKAHGFLTTQANAEYIVARDSALTILPFPEEFPESPLHIVASPKNTELMNKINEVIAAMKQDGTMDVLYAEYVTACIETGEPTATIELPKFDGAETITIGVSGDLPPIDYVNTAGKPVGFNMAVIAEIAKRLEINIDTEIVASGTRFLALGSGRIDAFFWEISVPNLKSSYLLSEPYAQMPNVFVIQAE